MPPNSLFLELIRTSIPIIKIINGIEKIRCGILKLKKFSVWKKYSAPMIIKIVPKVILEPGESCLCDIFKAFYLSYKFFWAKLKLSISTQKKKSAGKGILPVKLHNIIIVWLWNGVLNFYTHSSIIELKLGGEIKYRIFLPA